MRTLAARIERAEQAAKLQRIFSVECICFPENETPFFGFEVEEVIAAKLQCPLHGRRFKRLELFIYAPTWRREKEPARRASLSAQYQRAWLASFPPELWPAEEVETEDGTIFLRLKNGTRLLAYEPEWKCSETGTRMRPDAR